MLVGIGVSARSGMRGWVSNFLASTSMGRPSVGQVDSLNGQRGAFSKPQVQVPPDATSGQWTDGELLRTEIDEQSGLALVLIPAFQFPDP